jgi:DNA processing protein
LTSEIIYQLSLSLVPGIGDHHTRILLQHFNKASAIFKAGLHQLEQIEGIGKVRAKAIRSFKDHSIAEKEAAFIKKYNIQKLFIQDEDFPKRLTDCNDAPALLFYKGDANLNAPRMIGIVGTRNATEYGKNFTEKLVNDLAAYDPVIVSGLALGIDAFAHKAALKNNLATIGVVGHGLDSIYPSVHSSMAREMIRGKGGLLTEFFSGTRPERHNFPLRNRIVASLCDAIIVVETHTSGGSMITAKLADSYNRDVFAVPGRATDQKSSGCNYLLKNNKAIMLTSADDLVESLGWKENRPGPRKQKQLFIELTEDEKKIMALLQEKGTLPIDDLHLLSGLSSSATASALLKLELEGLVGSLPGKMYQLL